MNYPLAFTNNSTIFANETNLSYFSTPRPLSAKIGGVLLPETFSRKKFPKNFPPKGRLTFCYIFGAKNYVLLGELFSIFMVRKIMRVKGTCRSANRGGSFCLLSIYQAGFQSPLLPESPALQKGIESGQKGAKVNIYLLDFVSPRDFRRQEGAKSKHIFGKWCWCVVSCAPLVVVSTSGICAGFRTCRTCHRLALVLWWCAPCLLSACLLCACGALHLNMALFRVLKGF